MEHISQSRPDSGLGLRAKVVKMFGVHSSLQHLGLSYLTQCIHELVLEGQLPLRRKDLLGPVARAKKKNKEPLRSAPPTPEAAPLWSTDNSQGNMLGATGLCLLFFFTTLGLELSDAKVYEP